VTVMEWRPVPLTLDTDPRHGGRWTSLRTRHREWLWTNPDPETARARLRVTPGAAFVDAGGTEECFPTIRGKPDHGDAWTRNWYADGPNAAVDVPSVGRLSRRISGDSPVVIRYEVTGPPATSFLHAVHALLDVGPQARLILPHAKTFTVLDDDAPPRAWPSGVDTLGPDDGTAVCALVRECREATVVDGEHALTFSWDSTSDPSLCSLLLWRNLCGWPAPAPYRSIGVEPMIGRVADLAHGEPPDRANTDAEGRFRWSLTISCSTVVHGSSFPLS
jgi:hypothetical protein